MSSLQKHLRSGGVFVSEARCALSAVTLLRIKTKLLLTTKDFSGFLCCEQSPPPQQGGDFSP